MTRLAKIKLSAAGLGHLAIEHHSHFRVPQLYAVLVFVFAVGGEQPDGAAPASSLGRL